MEIEFRDITTYGGVLYGLYEISNDGQLRNKKTGYITRGSKDADGYLRTHLSTNNGGHINVKLHQLVLRTFYGEPPIGEEEVNHKNEIKTDNRIENLEWCNNWYNTHYGTAKERMIKTVKERGSHIGYHPSKESITKMRNTQLLNRYPGMTLEEIEIMRAEKNRKLTKEEKSKILSEAQKKRWTQEMREQRSESMKGEGNPMYGKHHSEESIKKSAEGHKKPICQFDYYGDFIREWDSIADASRELNISYSSISNAMDSKWRAGGYYWKRKQNG